MSNLIKNVSPEDKKMLNRIFLRSFTVFASGAGGSVKAGADGWLYSIQPALCTPSSPLLTATTPMTPRLAPTP